MVWAVWFSRQCSKFYSISTVFWVLRHLRASVLFVCFKTFFYSRQFPLFTLFLRVIFHSFKVLFIQFYFKHLFHAHLTGRRYSLTEVVCAIVSFSNGRNHGVDHRTIYSFLILLECGDPCKHIFKLKRFKLCEVSIQSFNVTCAPSDDILEIIFEENSSFCFTLRLRINIHAESFWNPTVH